MSRERKVDIEKLADENLQEISDRIGEKVRTIVDNAVEEVNKILAIYGMEAKMEIAITEKKTEEIKE